MTIWLLLFIYIEQGKPIDMKHIDTFGSKENCMEVANEFKELHPPKGGWFACMPTDKTKGMIT